MAPRPRKPLQERRLDRLPLRFTAEEIGLLRQVARQREVSVTAMVREAALREIPVALVSQVSYTGAMKTTKTLQDQPGDMTKMIRFRVSPSQFRTLLQKAKAAGFKPRGREFSEFLRRALKLGR